MFATYFVFLLSFVRKSLKANIQPTWSAKKHHPSTPCLFKNCKFPENKKGSFYKSINKFKILIYNFLEYHSIMYIIKFTQL